MNMHVRIGSATGHDHLLALASASMQETGRAARPSPKRSRYEITWADAKALADAGLMPLSHYIDLAQRHGWDIAGDRG